MGVEPLAAPPGEPGGEARAFRGLFRPSFHSDVCITARVAPDGGDIEMVVLPPAGRLRALDAIGVRTGADPAMLAVVPEPWRARAAVSAERAARFARAMDALDRGELAEPPGRGCDGMSLTGEIADARGLARFDAWSPQRESEPAQHAYFAALHGLAKEALPEERAQLILEQLHGYLGLGLPVVDLGGAPRRVRIFGRLSYPANPKLVSIFEGLTGEEPLLMDMSNFENMGTGLYPLFRELAGRPGATVWCASARAREQLEEMGIEQGMIFDRIEDARAALDDPARVRS